MSSAVVVLTPARPAKPAQRKAKTPRKKTAPSVSILILKAVSASPSPSGVSLPALRKALKAAGYNVVKNKARIVTAIKRLLTKKALIQLKGSGASGSFKLNKKPTKPRKTKVVKKKKPKAKKVKKVSVKKAAGRAAKRSTKKKKVKSPKKAKRPAATKSAKKPKSPK
ncbi:histone H1 [Brachyistius frenatus]|uniref:histone H1 n=1 Tax=Brachyistius frenatus TaxID=100188 RepID=UPI0037E96CB7